MNAGGANHRLAAAGARLAGRVPFMSPNSHEGLVRRLQSGTLAFARRPLWRAGVAVPLGTHGADDL